jgi:hypothetical protein
MVSSFRAPSFYLFFYTKIKTWIRQDRPCCGTACTAALRGAEQEHLDDRMDRP